MTQRNYYFRWKRGSLTFFLVKRWKKKWNKKLDWLIIDVPKRWSMILTFLDTKMIAEAAAKFEVCLVQLQVVNSSESFFLF